MQNIINLDSDKKLIEKYKNHRKEFMELEKVGSQHLIF